jgi:hypothetical protein
MFLCACDTHLSLRGIDLNTAHKYCTGSKWDSSAVQVGEPMTVRVQLISLSGEVGLPSSGYLLWVPGSV